jgi:hypothetical protein
MRQDFIFQHIKKTAGGTFSKILKSLYGDKIYKATGLDFDNLGTGFKTALFRDHDVIYGHLKYKDIEAMRKFVFQHIHRTGGGTFRHILQDTYGSRFFWGKDRNITMKPEHCERLINGKHAVHGHFSYERLKGSWPLVTLLRHPVERYISHYYYYDHHWGISKDHDFVEYANEFSDFMLKKIGGNLDNVDLVLITEYFDESLDMFSDWAGVEISPYNNRANVTPNKPTIHRTVKKKLETILAPDMELYEEALKRFRYQERR